MVLVLASNPKTAGKEAQTSTPKQDGKQSDAAGKQPQPSAPKQDGNTRSATRPAAASGADLLNAPGKRADVEHGATDGQAIGGEQVAAGAQAGSSLSLGPVRRKRQSLRPRASKTPPASSEVKNRGGAGQKPWNASTTSSIYTRPLFSSRRTLSSGLTHSTGTHFRLSQ